MARAKETDKQQTAKSQEFVDDSASDSSTETASDDGQEDPKAKSSSSRNGVDSDAQSSITSDSGESATSSSSNRSDQAKRRSKVSTNEPQQKKPKLNPASLSSARKASFKPPPGYEPIKMGAADMISGTDKMFSDHSNKQIWHITAPASVPVTLIESLDVPAALRGEPILSHKGISYNMFAAASGDETLLMPQGTECSYSKVHVEVSRNFHIREVSSKSPNTVNVDRQRSETKLNTIPSNDEGEEQKFFANKEGSKKSVRQQPSGLMMRYQPYGSETNRRGPYSLPDPEADEAKVDQKDSNNVLIVPPEISDKELHDSIPKTPEKSGNSSRPKASEKHRKTGSVDGDVMELDGNEYNSAMTGIPRSGSRSKSVKEGFEKKEKKTRKEKS